MEVTQLSGTCSMYELEGVGSPDSYEDNYGDIADPCDYFKEIQGELADSKSFPVIVNLDQQQVKYKGLLPALKKIGFKKIGTYTGQGGHKITTFMKGIRLAR